MNGAELVVCSKGDNVLLIFFCVEENELKGGGKGRLFDTKEAHFLHKTVS